MATDIGPRIGIDGEAQFRSDLNKLTLQIKTMGTEMKAVTSAFDKNDESQEKLSAQSDVLTRQIAAQTEKLSLLQDMLEKSKEAYGENDDRVLKWQQQVNNATTALNRMKAQLRETEQGLSGVGSELDDVSESTKGTSKGFVDMKTALAILIANGISAAVSAIGDLVGSLVNLDEATEEFRIAQGKVDTAFESAGYGAEAAQRAYAEFYEILGDTGTAAEASQLLAKLANNEKDLSKWTEIAAGVSGTFGDSLPINGLIEAANETAKVGQITGVLADALNWAGISEDEFNKKLAAASSESERNQLIMDTLSDTYDDAAAAFYRNNETLIEARKNQVLMDQALAGLGTTIADIKNQIRSEFTPALSDLVGAFGEVLAGSDGASDAFGAGLTELFQTVSGSLPRFLSAGASIVSSIASGIVQALPSLLEALVIGVSSLFRELVSMGIQIMLKVSDGIAQGIPQLVSRLPEVIDGIINYITTELPQILMAGQEILMNLVTGIIATIPALIEALPQIIKSLAEFFVGQGPNIVAMGVQVLMDLVTGIIQAIPDLIAAVPQLITSFVGMLTEEGPRILAAGFEILGTLISGIIDALPELGKAVLQILEALLQGIADIWDDITSIGENIVRGIWEGISNSFSWLAGMVTGFFNDVVNSVTDYLGIASPSKLFENEIGRYMAQGVGVGFEKEMESVAGRMQKAIPVPTIDTMQNMATSMMNGLSALNNSAGDSGPIVINLVTQDGQALATWQLPYLRAAMRANPEVVNDR